VVGPSQLDVDATNFDIQQFLGNNSDDIVRAMRFIQMVHYSGSRLLQIYVGR